MQGSSSFDWEAWGVLHTTQLHKKQKTFTDGFVVSNGVDLKLLDFFGVELQVASSRHLAQLRNADGNGELLPFFEGYLVSIDSQCSVLELPGNWSAAAAAAAHKHSGGGRSGRASGGASGGSGAGGLASGGMSKSGRKRGGGLQVPYAVKQQPTGGQQQGEARVGEEWGGEQQPVPKRHKGLFKHLPLLKSAEDTAGYSGASSQVRAHERPEVLAGKQDSRPRQGPGAVAPAVQVDLGPHQLQRLHERQPQQRLAAQLQGPSLQQRQPHGPVGELEQPPPHSCEEAYPPLSTKSDADRLLSWLGLESPQGRQNIAADQESAQGGQDHAPPATVAAQAVEVAAALAGATTRMQAVPALAAAPGLGRPALAVRTNLVGGPPGAAADALHDMPPCAGGKPGSGVAWLGGLELAGTGPEDGFSAEAAAMLARGGMEEDAAAEALYDEEYGHDGDW